MFDVFLRRRRRKQTEIEKIRQKPDCKTIFDAKSFLFDNTCFSAHMANYIGETVTVFVESGGISGAGFTGILLFVNEVYIELLISIALPPACSLNNPCILYPVCSYGLGQSYSHFSPLGSLAIIPVDKITSFVHNLV